MVRVGDRKGGEWRCYWDKIPVQRGKFGKMGKVMIGREEGFSAPERGGKSTGGAGRKKPL